MKNRGTMVVAMVACLFGWAVGTGFGEDTPPNPDEMIAAMREMGKPGAMHKHLEPMVGHFNVGVKSWHGGQESTSSATASAEWMLGGRYLKHHYRGEMFGAPFTGFGLMGYNNMKKEYENVWIDDFGSGMSTSTGQASDDGKTITFNGVWDGPNDMKTPFRMVYQITDTGYTFTNYAEHEGNEVKEMELTYTRTSAPAAAAAPMDTGTSAPVVVVPAAPSSVYYYDPCRPCPPPPCVPCPPRSCRPRCR